MPLGRRILASEPIPGKEIIDFSPSSEVDLILASEVPTFLPNPKTYWGPGKRTKITKNRQEG